jgi:hypothetical protein
MRIFDALNTEAQSAFLLSALTAATEERAMDWAVFIPAEFHDSSPQGLHSSCLGLNTGVRPFGACAICLF